MVENQKIQRVENKDNNEILFRSQRYVLMCIQFKKFLRLWALALASVHHPPKKTSTQNER
jgi:hypothetical protein